MNTPLPDSMPSPGLETFVRRFGEYTRPFLDNAGEGRETVQIKVDHTLRVFELASTIVSEESFGPELAETARLAALFHDTGRFPQFATYGVFSDKKSENHASLGVKALIREQLLEGLPSEQRRTVLGAVFLHNVRSLPGSLPADLRAVTHAVRDADKLDIMPVMLDHLSGTRTMNKAVTHGIAPSPDEYSPVILEHFERREVGDYANMRWQNDFKLLVLSWIYDFNFPTSFRLLKERGHMQAIMDTLPQTPELNRVRSLVADELEARLATAPDNG